MILLMVITLAALLKYLPALIRNKHWRDLSVFLFFSSGALALSLLLVLDIKIPSPLKLIHYFIKDILSLHYE